MPRNVEIKAKVDDIERLRHLAIQLSGGEGTLLIQEDTFFSVHEGRLKLRQLQNAKSQLIFYKRPDKSGPKCSNYNISVIEDAESLKETMRLALGIKGVVKKSRTLHMVGQTRVHIDEVAGLGNFMELEVVLKSDQTVEDGQTIAENLMKKLEISQDDLLTCAYMDLLLQNK